jgi:hypothetical protein
LTDIHLPNTIAGTCELIRQLKMQFLWVDSLCIVQDSEDIKEQLGEMAGIFANAYVTIVVRQGTDADHGIGGIPCFGSRWHKPPRWHKTVFYDILGSNWDRRGWTYQEKVFSRRLLVLGGDPDWGRCEIQWHCHSETYPPTHRRMPGHDYTLHPTGGINHHDTEGRPTDLLYGGYYLNRWPDIRLYNRSVEEFASRDLTFQQDAIDAISGLVSVLSSSFKGGFVCGIPVLFLDAALLWDGDHLRRRVFTPGGDETILPSWSWVSWKGEIFIDTSVFNYLCHCPTNKHHLKILYPEPPRDPGKESASEKEDRNMAIASDPEWHPETESIVDWYSADREMSYNKPLNPSFQKYKACDRQSQEKVEGWRALHCGKGTCFVHDCDPKAHFRYPMPMRSLAEPPSPHERSPYLYCKTKRGLFQLGKHLYGSNRPSKDVVSASSNRYVDVVYIPSAEESHYDQGKVDPKAVYEFVAISAGSQNLWNGRPATDYTSATRMIGFPELRQKTVHCFINVLMIGWKDGVAYRKGIGRIHRNVWEREATEEIDLLLG